MLLAKIDFETSISDAFGNVIKIIPKVIAFLLILVIGYFIAKAIAKALAKILERVGFDKAVERGGVKKALAKSEYDASDILGKVIYFAIMLFVLQMAFGVFGPNPISDMITGVVAYLPKVVAAILIIVVASAIAAAVRELIDASLGGLEYGAALANATATAVIIVGIFAALNELQIAPAIVTGLFYALLAAAVGVTVIAVGGGGIKAMQTRWDNVLAKYDEEKPRINQERQGAKERIKQRAQERQAQAKEQAHGGSSQPGQGASRS